ncbi:MAG: hypothetical protein ACO1N0_14095 [Fluviicola sp.]
MHPNQFFTLIFLLLISTISYSQEISISKEVAESEFKIVGFWKNKLITYGTIQTLEVRMVDTASVDSKAKTIKIRPEIAKNLKTAVINCFIHDDFLYEVYYVFTSSSPSTEGYIVRGYNVLVKRNLNTMEIVKQQVLEHLESQVKFVKTTDNGFYICFGDSHNPYYGGSNFTTRSNYQDVVPSLIKGFDYDLEPLMELNLKQYELRTAPYLNELSFDENSNLIVPIAQREYTDDESGEISEDKGSVTFLFTNLSGDLIKTKLEYDLESYMNVSSVKIRFDEKTKTHKGILMVNSSGETTDPSNMNFGYMYAEWNESGKLLKSRFVSLKREDVLTPEMNSYAESVKLDLSKVSGFNLDSNSPFFSFLKDGSVLYAISNISSANFNQITNSKFILCISKDGEIKWSLTIPYSNNPLYTSACFFLENDQLHLYTKEFTGNFSTGSYQYHDTKQGVNSESVVMTERVIDLNSGNIISHKPIIEQQFKKFDPMWPIHHTAEHEYLIRYRNPKGNKDRWVKVRY